jgi:hypothetical protein
MNDRLEWALRRLLTVARELRFDVEDDGENSSLLNEADAAVTEAEDVLTEIEEEDDAATR